SAPMANVAPLETGAISRVYYAAGDRVQRGALIAALRTAGGDSEAVRSPIAGTITQEGATPGEVLQAGQPLAQVVDLSGVYAPAYVPEASVKDVRPGQGVDVRLDAVSGITFHGTVRRVLPEAAAALSPLPSTDYASGNFTKVTQRVPVQIALDGLEAR